MGETAYLSTAAGVLAEALYLQGRYHEAEEWTRTSEQTASPEDTASQIEWRTVWAKLLARRGAFGEAESLACAAVAIGRETDDPRTLADALLGFAEVLELAGREGEAFPLIEEALGLYQRKEILPSVERARARLAALQAPPATA
jgi:tetratricopeptide (TPR) repeat protein